MKPDALTELLRISKTMREADAENLKTIQAAEQKIRQKLADLDTDRDSARNLTADAALPQQRVGGDVLWQVWIGRRKRELQIQLARVLAQKGVAKRTLQTSFGKCHALEQLTENAQKNVDFAERNASYEKMLSLAFLRNE